MGIGAYGHRGIGEIRGRGYIMLCYMLYVLVICYMLYVICYMLYRQGR
jgi:hypothetical protein